MALGSPLFLLNLKTFPASVGPSALTLASELEAAGRDAGVAVAVAPATPDLGAVARGSRVAVLAQHADAVAAGATTGFVPVATLAALGVRGSLVNHSEHPLDARSVASVTAALSSVGLSAVVCARDAADAGRLAAVRPPYLAVEPPELIGGTRSVSTARPEVVVEGVRSVHAVAPATQVLCGAGIRSSSDVRKAIELGAAGVLVASAVALAARPREVLDELLSGF